MKPEIKSILGSRSFLYHILPAIIVFLSFMTITGWAYQSAKETIEREQRQAATATVKSVGESIEKQLLRYDEVLHGAAGLIAVSDDKIDHEDWRRYVASFDLEGDYPGVLGIGYVAVVDAHNLPYHTEKMKHYSAAAAQYHVKPAGDRPVYMPVILIEPSTPENRAIIGFDAATEPIRRDAMERARDTGTIAFTDKVELKNVAKNKDSIGFLAFMPVYEDGYPVETLEQRRQAIRGYTYAPLWAEDLLKEVMLVNSPDVGFRVYANDKSSENKLFESAAYQTISDSDDSIQRTAIIEQHGVQWIIDYRFAATIVPQALRDRPLNVLVAGIALSMLTAGLIIALLIARSRSMAFIKEREVQSAKDDLLSLASHQLRTPATGVKQYIGMVLEGYAGSIKEQQRMYLEKAYESNERQLRIINDLLYVAKADAGRIVLAKRSVRINDLVKDVTSEQRQAAKEKNISLRIKVPTRERVITGDKHCLHMAIENIVSNAIKYTPEDGRVKITVAHERDEVQISVKDSGIGICDEDKKLLFHRFSRIPSSVSTEVSGSGIGLYLARQLVNLHGGDISVESEAGKGANFVIHLPSGTNKK